MDDSLMNVSRTNDAYQIKGAVSHLNDVIVMLPIWFDGQIVGWVSIPSSLQDHHLC